MTDEGQARNLFFLICHHEEGFSPTRDLLFARAAENLRATEDTCQGTTLVVPIRTFNFSRAGFSRRHSGV